MRKLSDIKDFDLMTNEGREGYSGSFKSYTTKYISVTHFEWWSIYKRLFDESTGRIARRLFFEFGPEQGIDLNGLVIVHEKSVAEYEQSKPNPADWWAGRVVEYTPPHHTQSLYGHIVSLSRNALKEAILMVAFEDGSTRPLHPSKVTLC